MTALTHVVPRGHVDFSCSYKSNIALKGHYREQSTWSWRHSSQFISRPMLQPSDVVTSLGCDWNDENMVTAAKISFICSIHATPQGEDEKLWCTWKSQVHGSLFVEVFWAQTAGCIPCVTTKILNCAYIPSLGRNALRSQRNWNLKSMWTPLVSLLFLCIWCDSNKSLRFYGSK